MCQARAVQCLRDHGGKIGSDHSILMYIHGGGAGEKRQFVPVYSYVASSPFLHRLSRISHYRSQSYEIKQLTQKELFDDLQELWKETP